MNYHFYIADVFTREQFNGAQIAVFPQADGLTDHQLQQIAGELNLSETVFIFRHCSVNGDGDDHPNRRRMRIFSPRQELDFAGHPVIAAGFVLAHCGELSLSEPITEAMFVQNSGAIKVNISCSDGQPNFVQFSSKVSPLIDHFAPSDEEISQLLSLPQTDLDRKRFLPRLVSCGFPYLVVPVWNYQAVRKARFNYAAWSQSAAPQTAAQEILLFAPKSPFPDADFNVRLLGPAIGLHDDPPVGTAMPAFCAYLCSFQQTQRGTHSFSVDRGQLGSRRSVINLEMDNKREETLTVRIGGHAVLSSAGSMELSQP